MSDDKITRKCFEEVWELLKADTPKPPAYLYMGHVFELNNGKYVDVGELVDIDENETGE